jgi:hypothetical protein
MNDDTVRGGLDVWSRRAGALIVAAVAAYASYQHQRAFALHGGADRTSAGLWPLSVDGLLLLSTAALLKTDDGTSNRIRVVSWIAFGLGIGVSLAANIASAPTLAWRPVLVAGWPPVALLLAVELLTHGRQHRERAESDMDVTLVPVGEEPEPTRERSAEQVMWCHYQQELARGRTPSGAELDRVAGTNNFGRAVLRHWRQEGRIPSAEVLKLGNRPRRTGVGEEMTT